MRAFFSLVLVLAAFPTLGASVSTVAKSTQNGAWESPETWEGGKVPAPGDKVLIRPGHRVVYGSAIEQPFRSVSVGGVLSFDPNKKTLLNVGLLKIQPGENTAEEGFDCEAHIEKAKEREAIPALEVGTPEQPICKSATIRLTYIEGMDKNSCPAIVCCGGKMDFHGAPLNRSWVKLGTDAKPGELKVTLAEAASGWRVGDRVLVTGTNNPDEVHSKLSTEEHLIQAIDGLTVTLEEPIANMHSGTGEFRGEVANLSRNVVVESADPRGVRGHTMYHRHSGGSISYAEFRHLGKEGVLGRYSIHFHLVGNTMRGSSVVGASVWDSANRWITIHGTNYLVVRDCVGYKSIGHGFFLEDGTEVYNVLDRNLAIQANEGKRLPKQALPFDANEGAGFWWANSLNTFTRNVSCENNRYGYRFEAVQSSGFKTAVSVMQPDGRYAVVDIRTLPFVRFDDNEAHGDALYGINLGEGVDRVGPDEKHPFILRNTKIWELHYAFRPQSPSVLVKNMKIHRTAYGVYHPNYDHHHYQDLLISEVAAEPFNRGHDDLSAQHGVLTVDGLAFAGYRHNSEMPLIQISDDNPTGEAETHLRNVTVIDRRGGEKRALVNLGGGPRPTPSTPKGVPIYLHDWYGKNRHAKIVSAKARAELRDGNKYDTEVGLTGDESRVAKVSEIAFPKTVSPVDDLPPHTIITSVRVVDGKLRVRGTTGDNGTIRRVVVNDTQASASRENFAEWEATLPRTEKVTARAEDAAGNVEQLAHEVILLK